MILPQHRSDSKPESHADSRACVLTTPCRKLLIQRSCSTQSVPTRAVIASPDNLDQEYLAPESREVTRR